MVLILHFFFLISFSLSAADSGRIIGIVQSEKTGEPLPGTNVLLLNTLLGAAADLGGEFYIENVPPGTYTLEILNIGYQSTQEEVVVIAGETVRLTIVLKAKTIESPEIVVTGARRTTRKIDSPVTIATINADQLTFRNPATIAEVLPYESGVQMIDNQVSMRGSSGYARGAGSRISVLVDGFPALSFDNGTIYWDAIPVQNIERIEILKGPGSALYGSNALGGVINIITKPISKEQNTDVSLGGGIYSKPSDEFQVWTDRPMLIEEWQASHSRRFGPLGVSVGVGRNVSTGYRENGWYKRTILNSQLEYIIENNRELRSRIYLILDKHGSFTQWKSPFQPFHTPENTLDDKIQTHKLQWSTLFSRIFSPKLSHLLRLNLFQTQFDNDLYNNTSYSKSRTLNPEYQLNLRPGERHYISTGIDLKYHAVQADIWGDHTAVDAAVYIQDEIQMISFLDFTLGSRWDFHRVDNSDFQEQLNPKLGLTLDITKHLILRGSMGWGFRAPAMAEMFIESQQFIFQVKPNPDLKSETSVASEIGLYWQRKNCNLDMAIFHSHYNELIEPILDPEDQRIQFRNVTEALVQGFELTADWSWQFIPALSKVSYTYIDPQDLGTDDVLAYRHRHSLVISEQLALSEQLRCGVDFRYLSKMEKVQLYEENPMTGADRRVPVKLVSGFCSYSFDHSLRINLSVENLFQYYYVVVERNMAPVRLIKIRMDYTF